MLKNKRIAATIVGMCMSVSIIALIFILTMPNVVRKTRTEQELAKLSTTYSFLANVFALANAESNDQLAVMNLPDNKTGVTKLFETLKPNMDSYLDCATMSTYKTPKKECIYSNTYTELNGDNSALYFANSKYYKIKLPTGVAVWFKVGDDILKVEKLKDKNLKERRFKAIYTVYVDLNDQYPPNQWGKDLFYFQYFEGVGLVPSGHAYTLHYADQTCMALEDSGKGCAYKIITYRDSSYLKLKTRPEDKDKKDDKTEDKKDQTETNLASEKSEVSN